MKPSYSLNDEAVSWCDNVCRTSVGPGFGTFPGSRGNRHIADQPEAELCRLLKQEYGLATELKSLDQVIQHAVTRFRISLHCFAAQSVQGRLKSNGRPQRWATVSEIQRLPMSVTGRKFAKQWLPSAKAATRKSNG